MLSPSNYLLTPFPIQPVPGFKASSTVSPGSSSTRRDSPLRDYFFPAGHHFETDEEWDQREWAKEKRKRRKAKEKKMRQEIFITQHVAAILSRQEFILKLARSFMMWVELRLSSTTSLS